MAANPTYTDGTLAYGSATLTITPKAGGSTFTAIADPEFRIAAGSKRVEQTNQYGEPLKAFGIPTTKQGNCTVQLGATGRIVRGDTFTTDIDSNTKVWIIADVDDPYEKEGYTKQTISYFEKLN